ncbi:GNAT family N-acetyltransferase [Janthinobacterium fluminis]|uniref:GNAT family N-acetyltransferase n=1 Tax=Janthinobacterium fluminis TaxID=2987524 RepID=A0ABT5K6X1_9BURK|nr:GNAT family N-acetyltransferase [Janthinobacterium fluminis]MDC8760180.1 GNAT family N-acetyltransferase [Janthinobacterium fluminis]
MPDILIDTERRVTAAELAGVFARSGINRRSDDAALMRNMAESADLLVTAWDGGRLVGVARSLTDFCAACYLADLAVDRDYQRRGIGAMLVERTRAALGAVPTLLLLAAPGAMAYYPKIGFAAVDNGWVIRTPR